MVRTGVFREPSLRTGGRRIQAHTTTNCLLLWPATALKPDLYRAASCACPPPDRAAAPAVYAHTPALGLRIALHLHTHAPATATAPTCFPASAALPTIMRYRPACRARFYVTRNLLRRRHSRLHWAWRCILGIPRSQNSGATLLPTAYFDTVTVQPSPLLPVSYNSTRRVTCVVRTAIPVTRKEHADRTHRRHVHSS